MYYPACVIVPLVLLLTIPGQAQQMPPPEGSPNVLVFGSAGIGVGAGQTIKTDLHIIAGLHHEFTVGYNGFTRRTRALPPDAPAEVSFLGAGMFNYPQETMSMFSLGYGYVMYPRRRPDVWRYVIRLSGMTGLRRDVYNLEYHNYILSSSYSYDEETRNALGLLIEPCVQFTPTRGFGLTAGVYGVFNDHFSGAGVNVALLFGRVGNHKYIRKANTALGKERHRFRRSHPFRRYPKNLR